MLCGLKGEKEISHATARPHEICVLSLSGKQIDGEFSFAVVMLENNCARGYEGCPARAAPTSPAVKPPSV